MIRVTLEFDHPYDPPTAAEIVRALEHVHDQARRWGNNCPLRGEKRRPDDVAYDPDTRRYAWFAIASAFARAIEEVTTQAVENSTGRQLTPGRTV